MNTAEGRGKLSRGQELSWPPPYTVASETELWLADLHG